jgi:xanthine dehydrogenase accessory factor
MPYADAPGPTGLVAVRVRSTKTTSLTSWSTNTRPLASIVVLTHEDRFDIPALRAALASEAYYVGALGSRRNQERRRERLLAEGLDEEAIGRISGPSGLDVGASSPAETAVSILAEILAVRAGREGGRLKSSTGRIHAETG